MQEPPGRILCPLQTMALATPEAPAIFSVRRIISYAELDGLVSVATTRLQEAGCGPGARVALYLSQDERYIVLLLALLRIGCISVPLSTRLPLEGVSKSLKKAGCSALVSRNEELLGKTPPDTRGLRPEALLGEEGEDTADLAYLPLKRPATMIFTSGSTGEPKAALHTFGNHYYSALGSNVNIALSDGDRWLLSLPLYHVGGLSILFRCLLAGAAISLPEPDVPLDRSITELGITHVSLVATQLRRLLEAGMETGNLKAALLGGGPIPESLLQEPVGRGIPVHTSYGLTEMASQVTTTPAGAALEELRTSGRALPHREVSVSAVGEIMVRGKTLFAGYVAADGAERPLDAEGWFHTGDLGELDDRGNLRVLGRLDNLFISGGENVQPEEIEAALERAEGVERAVVVPVPDEEFNERPVAFVQTADGPVPGNLAEKLGETLPRFKVPMAFYGWPDDADTGGMKPDRRFFREVALRIRREV